MAIRDRFIELAQSQVGYHESGTNDNKYAEAFDTTWWQWFNGKKNKCAAWCAIWICWLFATLIGPERALKFLGCPAPKNNCAAGVPYLWEYLKALGWKVNNDEGQPGDIIFFNTSKKKNAHVGMIEAIDSSRYHTIEGNKSDAVGRGTYAKNSSSIYGIMRPNWSQIENEPQPEPTPTPEPTPAPTPEPEGKPYKVVNIKTNLRIRSGPGSNFAVVGYLKNGDIVSVYETSGSWARIGDSKWTSLNYLKPASGSSSAPASRYRVTAKSGLRLRGGPGTNYVSLTVIPNRTIVEVKSISNGWAYTAYGGYSGYASASYLTKV